MNTLVLKLLTPFLLIPFMVFASSAETPDPSEPLQVFDEIQLDRASTLEREAIKHTKNDNVAGAVSALETYILATGDFSILENSTYEKLRLEESFIDLKEKYLINFRMSTFFYLYVGLIGIFIAIILNMRKKRDRIANGLIGLFVFMHSFFLIHVSLYLSNYMYYEPHILSISAPFSFLYGPVLFFYFKRITENYTFRWKDIVHLLPTLLYTTLLIPIFALSEEGKLQVILGQGAYSTLPYLIPTAILKVFSLIIYGIVTIRLYRKSVLNSKSDTTHLGLQRTIVVIHCIYAIVYGVYAFILVQFSFGSDLLHIQLLAMTGLVLYIGYVAYANPIALVGGVKKVKKVITKYQNSGLTTSFSIELKEQLVQLLEEEKVYRDSAIRLESVAQRLGTTRHNASQVINEHFNLNFFELINKYRVEEAMQRLKNNPDNLNIIDIAYEVGYNNKVTFNKSFKRFCDLTPSQFLKLERVG